MKTLLSLILVAVALSLCACEEADDVTPAADAATANGDPAESPCNDLTGSWELVSIASDAPALTGEFETDPNYEESPTLKILNDTHWMFIRQSSDRFIHAQGGRYRLDPASGTYTEVVEYSALPNNIGREFTFDCHLEGDSIWHHVGGLGDSRYDETWRRVE